jgi:DHHC palmitoyltransferase
MTSSNGSQNEPIFDGEGAKGATMEGEGGASASSYHTGRLSHIEDPEANKPTTAIVEPLEIEMGRTISAITDKELDDLAEHGTTMSLDDDDNDDDAEDEILPNDLESLLAGGSRTSSSRRGAKRTTSEETEQTGALSVCHDRCCCWQGDPTLRFGNVRVLHAGIYARTGGWGVVGPHWFGPPCVVALVLFATYYFAYQRSWQHGMVGTTLTCLGLAALTLYNLLQACYRDPGIVVKGRLHVPDPVPCTWRWCETCDYYQPPSAAHCPDCDICVAGFDHHCVWMGTCIGVGA